MNVHENIKVLIADDTLTNAKIIEKYIHPRGYQVILASNGEEAVEMYKQHKPDLVLMDVMMPVKNGYEAAKEIKAMSEPHWVPILFISAHASIEDQIEGIEVGGDDYLTKPVDLRILEAKLSAMLRIVKMQKDLNDTYYKKAQEEMVLAAKLMENLSFQPYINCSDNIHVYNNALDNISGDIIVGTCGKNGNCYLMLADAAGHGLTAAISLIPATQIFFHMAEKDYSVKSIVSRINSNLYKLLPTERFVAATIACIDFSNQFVEIWNGSNPYPLFVNRSGEVKKIFEKSNFALGIVDNSQFETNTECFQWEDEGELILYSDGLIDMENPEGCAYGFKKLLNDLATSVTSQYQQQSCYTKILHAIENFQGMERKLDDVAFLTVNCKYAQ